MIFKKKIYMVFYYAIGYNLPNYYFPMGKYFNKIRICLLRGFVSVGNNCRVMRHVYVGNGENISIGDGCRINESVRLDNVSIGNHVMIARECVILGKMHEHRDIKTPMVSQKGKKDFSTCISDDVWLGIRVIVMPGVSIGKGTIIGAGAVLTKNTDEYGIYGGVPAKLIRFRTLLR